MIFWNRLQIFALPSWESCKNYNSQARIRKSVAILIRFFLFYFDSRLRSFQKRMFTPKMEMYCLLLIFHLNWVCICLCPNREVAYVLFSNQTLSILKRYQICQLQPNMVCWKHIILKIGIDMVEIFDTIEWIIFTLKFQIKSFSFTC